MGENGEIFESRSAGRGKQFSGACSLHGVIWGLEHFKFVAGRRVIVAALAVFIKMLLYHFLGKLLFSLIPKHEWRLQRGCLWKSFCSGRLHSLPDQFAKVLFYSGAHQFTRTHSLLLRLCTNAPVQPRRQSKLNAFGELRHIQPRIPYQRDAVYRNRVMVLSVITPPASCVRRCTPRF
jgi:hypothetical protein